jgi:hypothetical protein
MYTEASNIVFRADLLEISGKFPLATAVEESSTITPIQSSLLENLKSKLLTVLAAGATGLLNKETRRTLAACTAVYCLRDCVASNRWWRKDMMPLKPESDAFLSLSETVESFSLKDNQEISALTNFQHFTSSGWKTPVNLELLTPLDSSSYSVIDLVFSMKGIRKLSKEFTESGISNEFVLVRL